MRRGFTLVEILAVLAIVGAIVLVGSVYWPGIMNRTSLESTVQKIKGDLRLARALAVSRNRYVFFMWNYNATTKDYSYTIYVDSQDPGDANYGKYDAADELFKMAQSISPRVKLDYPMTEGGVVKKDPFGNTASSPFDLPATTLIFLPNSQIKYDNAGSLSILDGTLFFRSLLKKTGMCITILGGSAQATVYKYNFDKGEWELL